jgi:hypothetical protein
VLGFSGYSATCRGQGRYESKQIDNAMQCNAMARHVTKAQPTVEVRKNDVAMSESQGCGPHSDAVEDVSVVKWSSRVRCQLYSYGMARLLYATVRRSHGRASLRLANGARHSGDSPASRVRTFETSDHPTTPLS